MVSIGVRESAVRLVRLRLLGHLGLTVDGAPVLVPASAGRVLCFLGLAATPPSRATIAQSLWPDVTDTRASGNLRTALWRLGGFASVVVSTCGDHLALSDHVDVDYTLALRTARDLIDRSSEIDVRGVDEGQFLFDLLTDQEGEWVDFDRVRFRQIRLHALEALVDRLSRERHHARAIEVALHLVAADPLRESAHEVLIKAFLAEGNRGEALAQYLRLEGLLKEQLGLEPSMRLATELGLPRRSAAGSIRR